MNLKLKGKTVLITGASGGLGKAIAKSYAKEGAHLALCCYEASAEVKTMAKKLEKKYKIKTIVSRYDLGRLDSAKNVIDKTLKLTGTVDVLINNAVRFGSRARQGAGFDSIDEIIWTRGIRDNIEGAIQMTRLVAPHMRKQKWGRIVHVSSRAAAMGMAGNEYYGASKMALVGLNRSLAYSLGRSGSILTNVVEPGFTRTHRNEGQGKRMEKAICEITPIGRLLNAKEVAKTVVYLGSSGNQGVTGQVLAISGGL